MDSLLIYEIKDNNIRLLMDDIRHGRHIYKYDDKNVEIDSLSFVKYMKCDVHSKYIGLVGKGKIMIIDILNQNNTKPYEFDIHKYPQSRLETIFDVHIES